MYKLSLAVLASLFSSQALALDPGVSGVWFDPSKEGQGFELTAIDGGSAVFAWYTYTPTGEAVWLTGVLQETSAGVLRGDLNRYRGMKFGSFRAQDVGTDRFGSVEVRVDGCDAATVTWDASLAHADGTAYADGTMNIRKLLGPAGGECRATTRHGIYGGLVNDATLSPFSLDAQLLIERDGTASLFMFGTPTPIPVGRGFAMGAAVRNGDTMTTTLAGRTSATTNSAPINYTWNGRFGQHDYYTSSATPIAFTLTHQGHSGRPAALSALTGAATEVGGRAMRLAIAADGTYTGTDSLNCRYEGRFAVPDPTINAYSVTATVTACGDSNGSYSGRAYTIDQSVYGDGKALVIGLQGTRHSLLHALRMD